MTITVVAEDILDLHRKLGRVGPSFDVMIKFRRAEDYERKQVKGGIVTFAHREIPVEHETTEALIEAIAAELRARDAWIDRTEGGTREVLE